MYQVFAHKYLYMGSDNEDLQLEREIAAAERQLAYLEQRKAKREQFGCYSERHFVRDEGGKLTEVERQERP